MLVKTKKGNTINKQRPHFVQMGSLESIESNHVLHDDKTHTKNLLIGE